MTHQCAHCGTGLRLGLIRKRNHTYQAYRQCDECQRLYDGISMWQVWDMGIHPQELPLFADWGTHDSQCAVTTCDSNDVENHHFAPTSIFGPQADTWPQADLCKHHHNEWHTRTGIATGHPQ